MKKAIQFLMCCICLVIHVTATAQSKQKTEQAFVKQLNKILLDSKQQHWKYKGTMTVDSAFAINTNGILSVTTRYTDDDATFIITRMEAPVKAIRQVAYDLYLILEYKDEVVTVFESEPNSKDLKKLFNTNLFHIGAPLNDGYKQQEKLQHLLEKLLKYY
jgi:hypothetical protein